MKYVIGFVVVIFVALPVLSWVILINGWHIKTASGEHTGYVTAVETTGVFWKTGTAYIKTDPQSSQEDAYCIQSPQVYNQLEQYSESRAKVTVDYVDYLSKGIAHCNGEEAMITNVHQ